MHDGRGARFQRLLQDHRNIGSSSGIYSTMRNITTLDAAVTFEQTMYF
jgi:hypothetical protein